MRRRILLLTLSTTFVVVLAFAVPLAILIGRETMQRAIDTLQNQAQYTAFAVGSLSAADVRTYLAQADASNDTSTLVLRGDETFGALPAGVAVPSPFAVPSGLPSSGYPSASGSGFPTRSTGGFASGNPGAPGGGPGGGAQAVAGGQLASGFDRDAQVRVFVFASDASLRSGAAPWFGLLAGASVALLALAALAAVVVSRRISAPLTATADAAHRLSAGDLGARAPTAGPREVAEVGTALNRLAGRIDELIVEARETVADLSHRLRTPLTAMRLDADRLADPAEAELMVEHVSDLQRALTAAIATARRPEREGVVPSCDATAIVRERTEFWAPLAEDQGRDLVRTVPAWPVLVRAAAADLAAAVDALVENVLAHTPEGVGFRVTLAPAPGGGGELTVADDGPGIPAGALVRGRSDRGSSGLGLSIAARCAESSGGALSIGHPGGAGSGSADAGSGGAGGGLVRLTLGPP